MNIRAATEKKTMIQVGEVHWSTQAHKQYYVQKKRESERASENAYHQRNQNALILMENLYRNEIKCRMLLYVPTNRDPLSGDFCFSLRTRRCSGGGGVYVLCRVGC